MPAITKILCPVDFSECSRHALEQAVALAQRHQAALAVAHVFVVAPVMEPAPMGSPVVLEPARLSEEAYARMYDDVRAFTTSVETAHVKFDVDVLTGDPVDTITDRATAMGADLIVMGTHGRTGFQRLLIGSVAERVLRRAPCPVLTVPPHALNSTALTFGRVLCAINFSAASLPALQFASQLAPSEHAEILAFHVVEVPRDQLPPESIDMRTEFKRVAADRLTALIPPELRDRGIVRELVTIGTPSRQILHLADEQACDLIVLGVERRSPTDLLLFGSTTKLVLRDAQCPVLTVGA
jgi:nucleotide-binding universal stress UspA family protein